jgi:TonB family protein
MVRLLFGYLSRARAIVIILAAVLLLGSASSALGRETKRVARKARYVTNSGIILVHVESKSGKVIRASMLKSTGQPALDAVTVKAFKNARFKPGTVPIVKIPIRFTHRID